MTAELTRADMAALCNVGHHSPECPHQPPFLVRIRSANCRLGDHGDCLGMVEQDVGELGITDCLCQCHREPDTEAGSYIEDDPAAWLAFVQAVRRYADAFVPLTAHLGGPDAAAEIVAGSMLSYLADQHHVFVRSEAPQRFRADYCSVPGCLIHAGTTGETGERLDRPGNRADGRR